MKQLAWISFIIAVDVWINWYWIEVKKKDPNHLLNWIARVVIGIMIAYQESILVWLYASINICFIYWFLFDTILNLVRKKPLIHLGDHFLDALQKKYIGEFPAFVWKAILVIWCIILQWVNFDFSRLYSY